MADREPLSPEGIRHYLRDARSWEDSDWDGFSELSSFWPGLDGVEEYSGATVRTVSIARDESSNTEVAILEDDSFVLRSTESAVERTFAYCPSCGNYTVRQTRGPSASGKLAYPVPPECTFHRQPVGN